MYLYLEGCICTLQVTTLSNFNEYRRALTESVGIAAGLFPFLIIFFITMLCFNLFIAVVSYSFSQIKVEENKQRAQKEQEEAEEAELAMQQAEAMVTQAEAKGDLVALVEAKEHYEMLEKKWQVEAEEAEAARKELESESDEDSGGTEAESDPAMTEATKESSVGPGQTSTGAVGQGAGGTINSGFSNTQRLRLRMQGVSAFLTSGKGEEAQMNPLTDDQKKEVYEVAKGQDNIRRCVCIPISRLLV